MATEWKKVRLGETFTVKKGQAITKRESKEGPYPVILGGREPAYFIDRFNHEGKAIVVSRSGASAGYVSFWNEPIFITDGFLIEPNNDVCYEYIYYLMKNNQARFIGSQKGAAIPHVTPALLSDIDIFLPPLETQQKIAGILSAYDDLIENNRKQIKLLEEAAQKLYKEWFVKLNFPGHENVKIVEGVPEGWKKEKLGNLLPIVTGKKDANYGTKDGKYPFFTCSQEPIKAPDFSFDANAILLAGNGDLNVKIYRGQFEAYQRTYVLVPYESKYLFICYRTIQDNLRKLVHGASGSTIKFITKGMIESIEVLIPHDDILKSYNDLSESILSKIEILQNQIQLLQSARDKLLPRLMNGGLEV